MTVRSETPIEHGQSEHWLRGRADFPDLVEVADTGSAGLVNALRHVVGADRSDPSRMRAQTPQCGLHDPIDDVVEVAGLFRAAVNAFPACHRIDHIVLDGEKPSPAHSRWGNARLRHHTPATVPGRATGEKEDGFNDDRQDLP